MATTFEVYRQPGMYAANYCTLPKNDVLILTPSPVCSEKGCDREIVRDPNCKPYEYRWVHADTGEREHISCYPRPKCYYCGTDDPEHVSYKQHAWSDASECTRCGGVHGHGIGD